MESNITTKIDKAVVIKELEYDIQMLEILNSLKPHQIRVQSISPVEKQDDSEYNGIFEVPYDVKLKIYDMLIAFYSEDKERLKGLI